MERRANGMQVQHPEAGSFIGSWCVLFPATYLVHIAEEFWGGFPQWVTELSGLAVPAQAFLLANAVFWLTMAAAVAWVLGSASANWLVVALATIVLINSLLHLLGTILTGSYSPGLVSGVVLWLPLGLVTLVRAQRILPPRSFHGGLVVGLAVHALVPAVAWSFVRLLAL